MTERPTVIYPECDLNGRHYRAKAFFERDPKGWRFVKWAMNPMVDDHGEAVPLDSPSRRTFPTLVHARLALVADLWRFLGGEDAST